MAQKKCGSAGDKQRFTAYKASNAFSKNKKRKLARHIKANPNDVVAANVLKSNATFSWTRKAPNARTEFNSKPNKKFAHMLRIAGGNTKDLTRIFKLERAIYD